MTPSYLDLWLCAVDASAEYYRSTAEGLLFQALAPLLPEAAKRNVTLQRLLSAESMPPPGVPASREKFQPPPTENLPVGLPVEKDRIRLQVQSCPIVPLFGGRLEQLREPGRSASQCMVAFLACQIR